MDLAGINTISANGNISRLRNIHTANGCRRLLRSCLPNLNLLPSFAFHNPQDFH